MSNTVIINTSDKNKESIIGKLYNRISELLKKNNPAPTNDIGSMDLTIKQDVMRILDLPNPALRKLKKDVGLKSKNKDFINKNMAW